MDWVHLCEPGRPKHGATCQAAVAAFRKGDPVCLFDAENREGETDLLFPGQFAEAATMQTIEVRLWRPTIPRYWARSRREICSPVLQDLHMDEG